MNPTKLADVLGAVGSAAHGVPPAGNLPGFLCAGIGRGAASDEDQCMARVQVPRTSCSQCALKSMRRGRITAIARALRTFPEWDDCRFGLPEFAMRTRKPAATRAVEEVMRWVPVAGGRGSFGGNLVLLGPSGAGKTSIAVALCHRVLDAASNDDVSYAEFDFAAGARFVSVVKMAEEGDEHQYGKGKAPLKQRALDASLLLFDDVGLMSTAQELKLVHQVVDHRYCTGAAKPTIVTSGFTEQEFRDAYGATARRLIERGRVILLHPNSTSVTHTLPRRP